STSGNGEAQADDLGFCTEPPDGIEPSTYALRDQVAHLGLPARTTLGLRKSLSTSLTVTG
ncbi:hypothetical protein ACWD8I_21215, partial [Micromonospora arida]